MELEVDAGYSVGSDTGEEGQVGWGRGPDAESANLQEDNEAQTLSEHPWSD